MLLIYSVLNTVNGKRYIGQTKHSLSVRWKGHKSAAMHGRKRPMCCAIRKYGAEAFTVAELALAADQDKANYLEKLYIELFDTFGEGGYNATRGGDYIRPEHSNQKLSDEHKKALHAHLHRPEYRGYCVGHITSAVTKKKLRDINIDIWKSAEKRRVHGLHISAGKKGKSSAAVLKGWKTRKGVSQ